MNFTKKIALWSLLLTLIFTSAFSSFTFAAPKVISQEQAMAKYLIKKGKISYQGKNYSVYIHGEKLNPEKNMYYEVYFDSKGNLVSDKTIALNLKKLYIMALNKDSMQVYKQWNGTLIPCLIFGKTVTASAGKIAIIGAVTKSKKEIVNAFKDEVKDGVLSIKFASILWVSGEWFGSSKYEGIQTKLNKLYESKTGITSSRNKSGLYEISDNYSKHKELSVTQMFNNWVNTHYQYAAFLDILDNLGLTMADSSFTTIANETKDVFLNAFNALVPLENEDVFDQLDLASEYEKISKYLDLTGIGFSWSDKTGISISSSKVDIALELKNFFTSTFNYEQISNEKTIKTLQDIEFAADTTFLNRQDISSAEAYIQNNIDPQFKMPGYIK